MRFKGLDLNLLMTLKVLLDERSVSGAAVKLNVTQPAVSAALKKLRDYFKDELLIGNGKQMLLSSHALQIMPELNTLLKDIDNFVSKTTNFSPDTTTRRFTLAANDYFCSVVLAPVLARLVGMAPGIKLKIVPIGVSAADSLSKGEVDLVFSPENSIEGDFHTEVLFREGLAILACKKNARFRKPVEVDDIAESNHVLTNLTGVQHRTMVQKKLSELNITVNDTINLPSFLLAPELIQNTDLIAIIHKRLAHKVSQRLPLVVAELPEEVRSLTEFNYCAYSHKVRSDDAGITWLLTLIKSSLN